MSSDTYPNGRPASWSGRSTEYLSRGFEVLLGELQAETDGSGGNEVAPFDLIIIGSGYGGAMAAAEFSKVHLDKTGKKPRICVLERGTERLPGMFPSELPDLPTEVRVYRNDMTGDDGAVPQAIGYRKGLFDIRVGDGCAALLANGLGGGSLINAGVMLKPTESVFQSVSWPQTVREDSQLGDLFDEAMVLLGSKLHHGGDHFTDNTITNAGRHYEKYDSLRDLAKSKKEITPVPITVKLQKDDPDQAIATENCISCGDCFSGCNFNAKKSLDTNLLATAAVNGVEIYCGVSVLSFDKTPNGGWELQIVPTDEQLQKRVDGTTPMRCKKLIVAAGTFGSTELLLRSEKTSQHGLAFSKKVGARFNGNGDMLVTISDRSKRVNSVASEKKAPAHREVGPTITGMIDFRAASGSNKKTAIQDLSVPAILHGLLAESTTFSQTIDALARADKSRLRYSDSFCTLAAAGPMGANDCSDHHKFDGPLDGSETDFISALALMGEDNRSGRLYLPEFDFARQQTSGTGAAADESFAKAHSEEEPSAAEPSAEEPSAAELSAEEPSAPGLSAEEPARGKPSLKVPQEGVVNFDFSEKARNNAEGGTSDRGFLDKLLGFLGFGTRDQDFYHQNTALIEQLVKKNDKHAWPHANPVWKPLGTKLGKLFNFNGPGMLVTVHPLGGCPMGNSANEGVVDQYGQVFDGGSNDPAQLHDGLVVLDGSILPTPAGINPALTIATLALRASRQLRTQWFPQSSDKPVDNREPLTRPVYKKIDHNNARPKKPTSLELVERLVGTVPLTVNGKVTECVVELRLRSEPFEVAQYTRFIKRDIPLRSTASEDPARVLPDRSYIRIFKKCEWDKHHHIDEILQDRKVSGDEWTGHRRRLVENYLKRLDKYALCIAPVDGKITLLEEIPQHCFRRMIRGVRTWWVNRGRRDISQSTGGNLFSALKAMRTYLSFSTAAVFAHAGRERRMFYDINVGELLPASKGNIYLNGDHPLKGLDIAKRSIKGSKLFQYREASNPWRQLMDIYIDEFPLMAKGEAPMLSVDPEYFALTRAPLLHIYDEDNAVDGYADLFAFYAQVFRVFLLQQMWTLRKPDTKPPVDKARADSAGSVSAGSVDAGSASAGSTGRFTGRSTGNDEPQIAVNRLPGELPGLVRTGFPLALDDANTYLKNSPTVQAQLTRYQSEEPGNGSPVLCIHGYSASGTTFAHPALYGAGDNTGGLVAYLARTGREVWVLDMRCSAAMPGRTSPWRFEDMAYKDIPAAVAQICDITKSKSVDIVAHCMGAVMLSIALLAAPKPHSTTVALTSNEKQKYLDLHGRIGKVVLSQAGPYLRFTNANTLRSFVLSYVRRLLPEDGFEFNPSNPDDDAQQILDRFLNTLPYSDNSEFKRENPEKGYRFWVRARHRMDSLYGRTFNLKNMSDEVLDNIDDFFGPVNFRTLEQTLWISNRKQVSDREGGEYYLNRDDLKRWQYPTLWIHGQENGLVDSRSPSLTALICDEQKMSNFTFSVIPDTGHQDCLMGRECEEQFKQISSHLCE